VKTHQPYTQRFLLSNTLWIYLTLFLFLSFLLLVSMVKDTWSNYLFYAFSLFGLYLPVLLFALFRRKIVKWFPKIVVWGTWLFCFVIYPFLLSYNRDLFFDNLFPLDQYKHGNEDIPAFKYSFSLTINSAVIATELGILSSDYLKNWINQKQWFQRFGLETMLLILMAGIAIVFGVLTTMEIVNIESFGVGNFLKKIYLIPYYSIQVFIIFLGYYGFYYLNKNYLIPAILKTKGIIYYGFAFVASILLFYPFLVFFLSYLPIVRDVQLEQFASQISIFAMDRGLIPGFILLLSVPVIVAVQWFEQNNQIASLQKEKSETELNLLKLQINPHFFFNILNNLYALSITKDKRTPEVILQLSDLMRYVIYKGKEDLVPLIEEITYIEDYIELQKIRLHKQLAVQFEKSLSDEQQLIPPLLFIIFVENAFKHGIEPAEDSCFLHLSIRSDEKELVFECNNSIENKLNQPKGIGLENLKRRLDLHFPNRYELNITETPKQFKAFLKIKTA